MIDHIVIVGGGLSGSLLAAKVLKDTGSAVTLVESSEHRGGGGIGGESLTPSFVHLVSEVLPSTLEWLEYSDAHLKWGNKLIGWGEEDVYVPQFVGGSSTYNHNIRNFLVDNPSAGLGDIYEQCTPSVSYMKEGNMSVDFSKTEDWAVNLDSGKLTEYVLKHLGGLERYSHVITEEYSPVLNGNKIEGLEVATGLIQGQLYIDATGPSRGLISHLKGLKIRNYKDVFSNDKVIYGYIAPTFNNFVSSYTGEGGWHWEIPLASKSSVGYVFNSKFVNTKEAFKELKARFPSLEEVTEVSIPCNRLENPWLSNVVTIGSGQGIIDPLEANILLHTKAHINNIVDFIKLGAPVSFIHANKFNTLSNQAWEGMASFLELHYRGCNRQDTEYWRSTTGNPHVYPALSNFILYNHYEYKGRYFDWEKWAIVALGLKVVKAEDLIR
jgi:tryptophan halogenase